MKVLLLTNQGSHICSIKCIKIRKALELCMIVDKISTIGLFHSLILSQLFFFFFFFFFFWYSNGMTFDSFSIASYKHYIVISSWIPLTLLPKMQKPCNTNKSPCMDLKCKIICSHMQQQNQSRT